MNNWTELFVPGRLCLFGEHSDWAGGHRRQNSELEKGYALVCPTNHGTYARIRKIDDKKLIMKSTLSDRIFEVDMQRSLLDKVAKDSNNLFNYVAGVAYYILERYDVIFRSPGVYRYLPELIEAEKAGVKISNPSI